MPLSDPLRLVWSIKSKIGIAEDLYALAEHVLLGVPAPRPPCSIKARGAFQVAALGFAGEVVAAVVLVQCARADQPEVASRNEVPGLVNEDVLRLDRDVAGHMEDPQHRLPRRFRAGVGQGKCPAQQRRTASSLRGSQPKSREGSLVDVQHVVDEQHKVQQSQRSCAAE